MNRDDEIFGDALDLPPTERAAYLDRACAGDPGARARIEALLTGYETAGDFWEKSPVVRPAVQPEERPGDVLGRYTLLHKIGEGGCGVVYLAEQTTPVRRRVALKVIKLGMDTRQVITRFEAERQALAMMDHPNIARVFDAGATEAGRPFFVMEYVDGVPITKFCDEHGLPMAERLELFARVCLAMQHAHQKGIIHRDVKPSNILVALHDGVPTPKVIDFGIAKATQDRLTEQTLVTGVEQFIGTPAYMSPEQADLRDLDIDTRSDVYSLGVLLYEMLTSRLPFEAKSLQHVGVDEIRRIIRDVEPPRPSQRVSTLADADRATVARLRGAGPALLKSALRGDLDWIVMRCLEKDRARRYSSAQELADDVRRHLRQEPVEACPPSTAYRVERFVARHRLAVGSTAAVATALVIGTIVSVRQAVRATRAEHVANTERDAATLARTDAQRRQEQAEGMLTFLLGDFQTELKKVGRLQLLEPLDEKLVEYFAALDPRDLSDTALARQSKALTQIGTIRIDEARYPEATAAFTAAYQRAAALAARHPQDGDMLFERAQAEYWIGFVARKRGDFATTREWLTHYRDSAVALVAIEGKNPRAQRELTSGHHNLAVLESDDGKLAAARSGFLAERAAIEAMLAGNPDDLSLQFRMADVASWLGSVAERDGSYSEALDRFTEMSTRVKALITREPAVPRWQLEAAHSLTFMAEVQALLGRRREAQASYALAQELLDALVKQDSKNQQWKLASLRVRLQQVALLFADNNAAAAAPILAETQIKLEALVRTEPSSRVFTRVLAEAWWLEGRMRMATQRADAREAAARAVELSEPLINEARADHWVYWEFAQSCLLSGRIAMAEGHADAARRDWVRARAALAPRLADSNDWRLLDPAAQALVLLGSAAEARPLIERLQRFGYHPTDPLAVPILGPASPTVSPNHNQ